MSKCLVCDAKVKGKELCKICQALSDIGNFELLNKRLECKPGKELLSE